MKFIKQARFFIFLLLFPTLALANPQLQEAQKLIDQGQIDKALTLTEGVLKDDSANIEARFLKGLLLAKAERLDDAEIVFNQLTEDHPELPEPYNNLAVVYAAQGKFDEARDALRRAINTHPSYATAHENLGDIYAKMASRAYNQALELDDGNASAREKLLLVREIFTGPVTNTSSMVAAKVEEVEPEASAPIVEEVVESVVAPGPVVEASPEVVALTVDPEIEKAVYNWASAWSAQDVQAYLNHYASSFVPPKGLSRSRWEQQRHVRLKKPSFIRVEISAPRVSMVDDNRARASFIQAYASDNYNDQVKKTLLMAKEGGRWKIMEEASE